MPDYTTREISDLEVILRTNEHADKYAVSYLLARGLIIEWNGALYLTRAGRQVLQHAS